MKARKNKHKQILFLVEGETEIKFIETLKLLGKVKKYNLWNNDISKLLPTIKADLVYIVYDTDITRNTNYFQENLIKLKQAKIKFSLLQQTLNLEDEIIRCSSCKSINQIFGTTSATEFKTKFLSCSNLEQKLEKINFSPISLWTGEQNEYLLDWQEYRCYYSNLACV